MKKHLEQGHLKWVRKIKASALNEVHEMIDPLGEAYILRVMEGSRQKIKMWNDLSLFRLPHVSWVMKVFHEGDSCYVLEKKFEGTPLSDNSKVAKSLRGQDIIHIGIGLARDLGVLFCEKGILHLDIKPENILIDIHGNGRLIDFGAAVTAVDRTNLRATPQMGTPRYMSPERYSDPNRIGASADLYSLALTLKYAMVRWEVTHFSLWQVLSDWSNPTWLESIEIYEGMAWYKAFIGALEGQLTT